MSGRHRFYRHLFLLAVGVMVLMALPYPERRLSVLFSLALNLLLVMVLGRPHPSSHRHHDLHRNLHLHRHWPDHLFRLIGIATFGFQLLWLFAPATDRASSALPVMVLLTIFVFWSLKRLLIDLSRERKINGQVLMGAVAGYLLLGISGGLLFSMLETMVPGSFLNSSHDHRVMEIGVMHPSAGNVAVWTLDFARINYFAFVSLTTVGYGDIVPATPPAQMASVALSVSGPLYLAVVMGLLISRYTVQEDSEKDRHLPPRS